MHKEKIRKLIPVIFSAVLLLYHPILGLVLSVFNLHANTFYPPYSTLDNVWLALWIVVAVLVGFFYLKSWWQRILCILLAGPLLSAFQMLSVSTFGYLYVIDWVLLTAWIFFIFYPVKSPENESAPFAKDARRWLLLGGGCFQIFIMARLWSASHFYFGFTLLIGFSMIVLAIGGWKKKWAIPLVVISFLMHGVIIGFSWLVPMVGAWLRDSMNY